MTTRLTPPLKWYGGKNYLAKWLIDLMPRHVHYVEPYAGGLAVLLAKDPNDPRHQWGDTGQQQGVSEVVNDLYEPLTNFWEVMRHPKAFADFRRCVEATPFSERFWNDAKDAMFPKKRIDVAAAIAFFVRCRQSRSGGMRCFATLSRNRTRRRVNEQASAWWNCVDGLEAVHNRLRNIVVLCRDALGVLESEDGEKTLFYLDPPYMPETRTTSGAYACEMDVEAHGDLLDAVDACQGRVMLSGYRNDLYDHKLSEWTRHDRAIDNKMSSGRVKPQMTESLWCNF